MRSIGLSNIGTIAGSGGFSCVITFPTANSEVAPNVVTTITGTISKAGTVNVYLGATLLGAATISGLTWSYAWTPANTDGGANTLNATATATVGGATVNATGIPITIAISFANLFSGSLQIIQTDKGLTYGGTLRDTGGTGPILIFTGSLTGLPVPIWVKCTLGGALGTWTYAVYYDGVGTSSSMTGTSAATIVLTGAGAGLTVNIATGTATINNIWKATCSALADQSGNSKSYSQATASKQPLISIGLNGKAGLLFDGVSHTIDSSLNLPAPGTTPSFIFWVFRSIAYNNIGILFGPTSGTAGSKLILATSSTPNLAEFNGGANTNTNSALAINSWGACEAYFSATTSDYLRLGATTVSGTAVSATNSATGRQIGNANNLANRFQNMELLAVIYMSSLPSAGTISTARSAVNSAAGYGVGNVAV